MAWEENSCICLNMQLIAILSRIGVMFCILFTMCTYPSQSVKISIHSCTFSKNLPIRRLMPFQYIPFFLMLIYLVIYFVINSCANTPSAQYIYKNTKNIQKKWLYGLILLAGRIWFNLILYDRGMLRDGSGRECRNHPVFPALPSPWVLASCGTPWCGGRWLHHGWWCCRYAQSQRQHHQLALYDHNHMSHLSKRNM